METGILESTLSGKPPPAELTLLIVMGAWRFNGAGDFTELWIRDIANSNQALYYPDTGEVILDDVLADQSVDAVVVDLETGLEKGRVATGTLFAAGMMACPGFERDFYVASGVHGTLCRVYVSET